MKLCRKLECGGTKKNEQQKPVLLWFCSKEPVNYITMCLGYWLLHMSLAIQEDILLSSLITQLKKHCYKL